MIIHKKERRICRFKSSMFNFFSNVIWLAFCARAPVNSILDLRLKVDWIHIDLFNKGKEDCLLVTTNKTPLN